MAYSFGPQQMRMEDTLYSQTDNDRGGGRKNIRVLLYYAGRRTIFGLERGGGDGRSDCEKRSCNRCFLLGKSIRRIN